jgi:DNA-binding NarL/FixJ family response regulator
MKKILLVDDHKIIRDGVKALLKNLEDIQIVGECEDGDEVLDFCTANHVDVVLMDINMKRMSGIDATTELLAKFPNIKVVALTMHNEEGYISKILKAGAVGYLLKNAGKAELLNAINTVSEGRNYFGPEVAEVIMSRYMKTTPTKKKGSSQFLVSLEDLTKREIEVIKLIAEELTTTEISEKLFISPRTVDSHRRNLLQKIGVKNTAGLVKFALQNGIID